jgi:hypothetical protein
MTDLKDTSIAPAPTPGVAHDHPGPDPLASLHKMSTTAGITSQEYVAINIPSILALLLGVASVLAVLSPVFLLLPVAGVVVSLVALSQIRASNGTQTGRAFALTGIVLSLAIGGFVLVRAVVHRSQTAADRDAIVRQIAELGRYINARDYEKAYAMFSDRFHNRVNRGTFDAVWEQSQAYPQLGRISSMRWNETSIFFQDEPGTGTRVASAYAWVQFEKSPELARHPLVFRKVGGKWIIDDASQMFPSERRRPTPRT